MDVPPFVQSVEYDLATGTNNDVISLGSSESKVAMVSINTDSVSKAGIILTVAQSTDGQNWVPIEHPNNDILQISTIDASDQFQVIRL